MTDTIRQLWAQYGAVILFVLGRALACILIAAVAFLATRIARRFIMRARWLDDLLRPMLSVAGTAAIYVVAALFILDRIGINTAGLVALVGAAGLTIGFALRDTLANIAAGIMLLVLRPFKAGDFVTIGATSGTVDSVRLFNTVLKTADGLYVSEPNSAVAGAEIINFSRNPTRRVTVTIGIAYEDELDIGLEVFRRVAAQESRFLPDPAPSVAVSALADSSVNLTLRGWVRNADYWTVLFDLTRVLKLEIDKAGLSIPFPQREIRIIKE